MLMNAFQATFAPRTRREPAATRLGLIGLLLTWTERARKRRALSEMDEHLLRDVGLTEADIGREAAKPFWRR